MKRWRLYRPTRRDRDGLWLVKLRDKSIALGRFYCGSFVMDGFRYNETAGMTQQITHVRPCPK